ncbi:helix-turn-helix transcriptional regulator [Agrobacterium rubi]|uniref:helix-turn-helix transcriptional regulator n=1 Tax=Agrobacterium rubi TaxID=28099 RepID=UPI000B064044|nr:helix-turn-helix domain-containing protein [Agrobacterium rubi]MBP1879145.1 putative DNA-binding transcriptional regulator AlpA [Agrobacterium rubi]
MIGRKEAAAYLGIGESTFSLWVSTHKMPPPVPGTRRWDRKAIDAKLDAISGIDLASDTIEDEFEKWEREQNARKAGKTGQKKTLR